MNPIKLLLVLVPLWWSAQLLAAPVRAAHVDAELVAEHTAWLPGVRNAVALRLKPDPGWHTYWRNPGDSGLATRLEWQLPADWIAGDIQWPYPQPHRLGDLVNYGYDRQTLHLVDLDVPAGIQGEQTIAAKAHWLVCADICIPGSATLTLTLPVSEIATVEPQWLVAFADARDRLPNTEELPGLFATTDTDLMLQVDLPAAAAAGAQRAEFFAFDNDLLNHGAPQHARIEAGIARFTQARSAYTPGAPDAVEGVLVVHGAETFVQVVRAVPGAVMPVLPPLAPPPVEALTLLSALGLALLGGLILNLMPCVFPVLSIKAVSLLESRAGGARHQIVHALTYTAGVVLSCVAIAGALLALRASGQALGWGFQLQSPVFNGFLVYLLFVLGLSLSGVVAFGTRWMGLGQSLTEQGGLGGSFFTGVLATVVATPCTAPFMGAALGYALVQPAAEALMIFAALGGGLALPFLLLALIPGLGRLLPRPGAWMESFKQFMAFPLYLSAVWLLWVLGRQTTLDGVAVLLVGLVLLAFSAWLAGAAGAGLLRKSAAVLGATLALALLAHPALALRAEPVAQADVSGEWSVARVAALRAQGQPVFVNFTADWCITCKVNERSTLDTDTVRNAMQRRDVAWLTADWTRADPAITEALQRYGRSGVPLYLLYPAHGEPRVLPQILTVDLLVQAVEELP